MKPEPGPDRLSRISTLWTLVGEAHQGSPASVQSAQAELLRLYGGAVRRYLQAAVRDPEAVEELFQEFACALLHGDLRKADPERGRFRDLVKGVLFYMIADHHKRKGRQHAPLQIDPGGPDSGLPSLTESERAFVTSWREEVMARAWAALAEWEHGRGKSFYTVLRFRAEHPDLPSAQMAEQLSGVLGKPLTPVGVRQLLHRAREKFADLLLDDIVASLADPTPQNLEQELATLELLDYCRDALKRRR
jgi:RNA polymerase sigma-70 factor (ECF subfamily)